MPHDDFAVEPVRGLPERPPEGELVLWQGRPAAYALARDALNMNWVAGYFMLLAVWRVGVSSADMPFLEALPLAIPFVVIGFVAVAVLYGIALILARTTVYTITTARVAMRIGAALTVTLNLPFAKIESADLSLKSDGSGTIAFTTAGDTRLSFLILWPHVRPWKMRKPEPALRAIPDAANVARLFADAAEASFDAPEIARRPARAAGGSAVPAE
ncbi:photosynthetic complex putative assembly protein PuhB [Ovoidimarina sediminis]|uniref:photosynthetic complex putative assembly protein PuhB n=1 Tax=Ovoidimarina sediminis TaxID=3079856 RepID=UPI002906E923|nr:photosynthetic complex putative assembly protein PuhB [Rhodophyticola sp. MJ-SS7]MDU8944495.1 photosynthetic complex putative assembly protein PuhB [Rhodophyticola sp. MJ-SS7]